MIIKYYFVCFLLSCSILAIAATPFKILVVVGCFPHISEVCILNQITGLIDRGHEVTIFALGKSSDKVMHRAVTDYKLLDGVIYGTITCSQLKQFDIILCQFGTLGKQFARYKKKYNLNAQLVTCFRGYDTSVVLKKNQNTYAELFEVGDLFLPVCDHFKKKLMSVGASPDKVVVQHSVINCSLFPFHDREMPKDGSINIMTASRLVPKKGHVYMLRALAQIIKKYPRIRYTIIGSGSLHDSLNKLVHQLGLDDYVQFIPAVPQQKLTQILDSCDLFVLPSVTDSRGDTEGIPNALKEAMAKGIPVISTYHSGIPELITDNYNGLLVPERDSDALAQVILYAIEHPQAIKTMTYNAYQTVLQEYELEHQNDKLEHLLVQLCNKKG